MYCVRERGTQIGLRTERPSVRKIERYRMRGRERHRNIYIEKSH